VERQKDAWNIIITIIDKKTSIILAHLLFPFLAFVWFWLVDSWRTCGCVNVWTSQF
jgi:hypothetical protein